MKNLYSFNKNSNHVKLFKWAWGVDPTKEFKSMCPYFWAYVGTIIVLPFILITKLLGKSGEKFNSYMYNYRKNKKQEAISKLIKRFKNVKSGEEAYQLYYSKCAKKYRYENELYNFLYGSEIGKFIEELVDDYIEEKEKEAHERSMEAARKRNKREATVQNVKGNKIAMAISMLISVVAAGVIVYGIFVVVARLIDIIDWTKVGRGSLFVLEVAVVGFIIYLLIAYVFPVIGSKLACIKLPKCRLCKLGLGKYIVSLFRGVKNGFLIIIDMIRNTYKKNCPLITWEDEE